MPYADPDRQREYQRQRKAKIREEWLQENGPCVRCGSWDNLEVDHIDPSKKVDHKVWTWATERRATELAKCQVLCHDCHRRKTFGVCRNGHVKEGDNVIITKARGRTFISCRICRLESKRAYARRQRS